MHNRRRLRRLTTAAALAAGAVGPLAAQAEVSGSWVGGSGSWSEPTNWSSNPQVPGNGGAATFGFSRLPNIDLQADTHADVGTLTFDGPARYWIRSGSLNLVGPALLDVARGDYSPSRGHGYLITATLTGSAGLTLSGDGTLTLNGLGSYSGPTRVTGGMLRATPQALGAGSLVLDGGAFTPSGSTAFNGAIHLGAGGGTLGGSAQYAGVISGAGTLVTRSNSGSASLVQLLGTNTHTGPTVFAGGTVTFGPTGSALDTSSVTVLNALRLDASTRNRIGDATPVTVRGARVELAGGPVERVGTLTVDSGHSAVAGLEVATVTRSRRGTMSIGTLELYGAAPALSGTGAANTPGAGVLPYAASFAGAGAPWRPVTYENGRLRALNANEFVETVPTGPTADNLLVAAAQSVTTPASVNSLTVDNAALAGPATLTVNSGVVHLNDATVAAPLHVGAAEAILAGSGTTAHLASPISGSNGLTIGAGHVLLSGDSTYTGTTTVNGRLTIDRDVQPGAPGPLGADTSAVVLHRSRSFSAIDFRGGSTITFGRDLVTFSENDEPAQLGLFFATARPAVLFTGDIEVHGALSLYGSRDFGERGLVVTGDIRGDGYIAYPGDVTLSGQNTFTGGLEHTVGPLGLGSDTALGAGTFWVTGEGTILAVNGARTIANPVVMFGDAVFGGSTSLTITGPVNLSASEFVPAGRKITTHNTAVTRFAGDVFGGALDKAGDGVLEMRSVRLSGLTVTRGTLRIMPDGTPAGAGTVGSLTVAAGATPGTLDVADNALVVDYSGASPLATLRARIAAAYAAGSWTGAGITSSLAGAAHGVGYAEASDVFTSFPATFVGQDVDATSLLIRFARYGDANLDGVVNLQDFNRLAAYFGATGGTALWSQSDFNYDGNVNLQDFNRLAANFGLSASAGSHVTPRDWAALASAVPEPAGVVAPLAALAASLHRRRRRALPPALIRR